MNAHELFDLSGRGFYVWSSYGMLLLAVVCELVLLRRRRARALIQARQTGSEAPARQARVQEFATSAQMQAGPLSAGTLPSDQNG